MWCEWQCVCSHIIVCEARHRVYSALAEPDVQNVRIVIHLPYDREGKMICGVERAEGVRKC
jgi:hypothetical protein